MGPCQCEDGPADHEEVAGRLRIAVNRLQRRLRQESLGGLSPAQASALGSVNRHGSPTLGELAGNRAGATADHDQDRCQPGRGGDGDPCRRRQRPAQRPCADHPLRGAGARADADTEDAFLLRRLAELGPDEQLHAAELVALLEHLLEDS